MVAKTGRNNKSRSKIQAIEYLKAVKGITHSDKIINEAIREEFKVYRIYSGSY